MAVNANWASYFGHSFVIDTRGRATGKIDAKNAKVLVKMDWATKPNVREKSYASLFVAVFFLVLNGAEVFQRFSSFNDVRPCL